LSRRRQELPASETREIYDHVKPDDSLDIVMRKVHGALRETLDQTMAKLQPEVVARVVEARTKTTVRALQVARERGALTVCITSFPSSPITRHATSRSLQPSRPMRSSAPKRPSPQPGGIGQGRRSISGSVPGAT
jgi:DNA-binding MurR/RpiR family transcriptional regulator